MRKISNVPYLFRLNLREYEYVCQFIHPENVSKDWVTIFKCYNYINSVQKSKMNVDI